MRNPRMYLAQSQDGVQMRQHGLAWADTMRNLQEFFARQHLISAINDSYWLPDVLITSAEMVAACYGRVENGVKMCPHQDNLQYIREHYGNPPEPSEALQRECLAQIMQARFEGALNPNGAPYVDQGTKRVTEMGLENYDVALLDARLNTKNIDTIMEG